MEEILASLQANIKSQETTSKKSKKAGKNASSLASSEQSDVADTDWALAGSKAVRNRADKRQASSAQGDTGQAAGRTLDVGDVNAHAAVSGTGEMQGPQNNASMYASRTRVDAHMESVRLHRVQQAAMRHDTTNTGAKTNSLGASSKPSTGGAQAHEAVALPSIMRRDSRNPWNISRLSPQTGANGYGTLGMFGNLSGRGVASPAATAYENSDAQPVYKPPSLLSTSLTWTQLWNNSASSAPPVEEDGPLECIMCMNDVCEIVVVPCGHLTWCKQCANVNMEHFLCAQRYVSVPVFCRVYMLAGIQNVPC